MKILKAISVTTVLLGTISCAKKYEVTYIGGGISEIEIAHIAAKTLGGTAPSGMSGTNGRIASQYRSQFVEPELTLQTSTTSTPTSTEISSTQKCESGGELTFKMTFNGGTETGTDPVISNFTMTDHYVAKDCAHSYVPSELNDSADGTDSLGQIQDPDKPHVYTVNGQIDGNFAVNEKNYQNNTLDTGTLTWTIIGDVSVKRDDGASRDCHVNLTYIITVTGNTLSGEIKGKSCEKDINDKFSITFEEK